MKQLKFILTFCLFIYSVALFAGTINPPKYGKGLTSKAIVEYLASDELQGRYPSTCGDTLSADFFYNQLKKLGLTVKKQEFFIPRDSIYANNIYGYIPNKSNNYIVIGAHIDHLGFGGRGSGSTRPDTVAVHNGADDNASGVAGVLYLAKRYSRIKGLNMGLIFVAFGAEERGVVGSAHFAANLPKIHCNNKEVELTKENIVAMVNFDMIGNLKDNAITLGGTGSAIEIDSLVNLSIEEFDNKLKVTRSPQGYGPSDHASFYAKGIPVFYITTGATEDYHTPFDTPDKINYEGIDLVANFAGTIVDNLMRHNKQLSFVETAAPATPMRASFKVTLGLMPDVTGAVKDGLRASIVVKGKPAYAAGLKNGDIIKKINDVDITDIEVYMKALATLKKGDVAVVKVLRDGKELIFNVNL